MTNEQKYQNHLTWANKFEKLRNLELMKWHLERAKFYKEKIEEDLKNNKYYEAIYI